MDNGVAAREHFGIERLVERQSDNAGSRSRRRSVNRSVDLMAAASQAVREPPSQESADGGDEDRHASAAATRRPMRSALAMIVKVAFFAGSRGRQAPSTMWTREVPARRPSRSV